MNPLSTTRHIRSYFTIRSTSALIAAATVAIAGCTATTEVGSLAENEPPTAAATAPADSLTMPEPTTPTTVGTTTAPTTTPTTTISAPATATASTTTTTTTTTTTPTTTTAPAERLDVFDADCVIRVEQAGSMERLAAELSTPVTAGALWSENGFNDTTSAGDLVDTCVNNGVNDIDGTSLPVLDDAAMASALTSNVERQQAKLNELFTGLGTGDLAVDGVSGPRTGQRLCAARLALGLDVTIADMAPGTDEQAALFDAAELPTPATTATTSERWVLIDRTCQIMFIGSDAGTNFVFPTSTGSEGFETRDQDRAEAIRFNPALDNGGWHNSSEYPAGIDNPLNGNLYKPLYFDLGQAIHGANNVPPTPESKGCARLRVGDQETLVAWLGLDDVETELWRKDEMNVTINVQGEFIARP